MRFHMKKISSAKSGTQLPIIFQNGSPLEGKLYVFF